MTPLISIAILFGLGLLQVFLSQVWIGLGAIDWLVIYIALMSLRVSFQRSILLGAAGGLIQDALSSGIIGLHAFAKTCVAALIAGFGGLLVVRGPLPEAVLVATAATVEGLLVVAWQMMLERPVSLGPLDIAWRAALTAAAGFAVLTAAQRNEQRSRRRGYRR